MKQLALLISPLARGAFFADYLAACEVELGVLSSESAVHVPIGELDFFHLDLATEDVAKVARLSCVQGVFERRGDALVPMAVSTHFQLHADFVFGTKYRGKTNEVFTQFMLNLGLQHLELDARDKIKVLDPMCGRGTTLLWAMSYGLSAKGIEQHIKVFPEIHQSLKKWCKVHRQKHELSSGFVGASNKQNDGKFIRFKVGETALQIIKGDAADAAQILKGERFSLLISDLPYGIQHHTSDRTRNPLETLKACAEGWSASLKPGGVMVLGFNQYQPKRDDLAAVFRDHGLVVLPVTAPHRMSESIVRDVLVCKKPAG